MNKSRLKSILFTAFITAGLLFVVSCSNNKGGLNKTNNKIAAVTENQLENVRVYVEATSKSLDYVQASDAAKLAKKFNRLAQNIVGKPKSKQNIDVEALLSSNEKTRKQALKYVKELEALDIKHKAELHKLEAEREYYRNELIKMGQKYEEEKNKSIVKRVWLWGVGTFGLAGFIAFIIFCPAIALPLLGVLWNFLVRVTPSVIGGIAKGATALFNGSLSLGRSIFEAVKPGLKKNKRKKPHS